MPNWLAISAYSISTPYEAEAANLHNDLVRLDIPHKFYPYVSRGSWALNCEHNGEVVIRALREHKENIVYLDADARVHKYPKLFDNYGYDIGLYKRMHTPKQYKQLGTLYHWDTGTAFYRNAPKVSRLLERNQEMYKLFDVVEARGDCKAGWILDRFNKMIDAEDSKVVGFLKAQQLLYRLYNKGRIDAYPDMDWMVQHSPPGIFSEDSDHLTIGELPVTYSYIFDTKQPEEIKYKDDVVITHHQASRRHKDAIS